MFPQVFLFLLLFGQETHHSIGFECSGCVDFGKWPPCEFFRFFRNARFRMSYRGESVTQQKTGRLASRTFKIGEKADLGSLTEKMKLSPRT